MQASDPKDSDGETRKTAHWKVVETHHATYPDPIAFDAGDVVRLTGREDIWDGYRWQWAIAPDGREGWIPDSLANCAGPAGTSFVASTPLFRDGAYLHSRRPAAGRADNAWLGMGAQQLRRGRLGALEEPDAYFRSTQTRRWSELTTSSPSPTRRRSGLPLAGQKTPD